MPTERTVNLLAVLLGLLGAANALTTGIYIVSTSLALSPFSNVENLIPYAYVAGIANAICTVCLAYGSYLLWKHQNQKGGAINFTAGTVTAISYVYFTFFSQPSLLGWLGPSGYFLPSPAMISGALGCWLRPNSKL